MSDVIRDDNIINVDMHQFTQEQVQTIQDLLQEQTKAMYYQVQVMKEQMVLIKTQERMLEEVRAEMKKIKTDTLKMSKHIDFITSIYEKLSPSKLFGFLSR